MGNKNYEVIIDNIVNWMNEKVGGAGCAGGVVGLSGGIDSSVVAVLCKKAFGDNCMGLIMPCHSSESDFEDAKLVAEHLGMKYELVDLTSTFDAMTKVLDKDFDLNKQKTLEIMNLKPRLRMTALYYYANKLNYFVIGTGNKSEILMGYFTKYGDGGVDMEPMGDLTKTDVYEVARILGVPDKIIDRVPSAGLYYGQTDEVEMGITYKELDHIIECLEEGKLDGCDNSKVKFVESTIKKMKHKSNPPPACQLGK
ncbi:MAG: NAD+ synthase [Candidatus Eremiobacteraeota bacterium]|nr:NAD+ synthase [Candidatus Eremiobacteraeota bacterium]